MPAYRQALHPVVRPSVLLCAGTHST